MSNKSLVYKNVIIYRLILNIIYSGNYKKRFKEVCKLIGEAKTIVEICFGDIYIAEFCKKNSIQWIGYDINEAFIKFAKKKRYDARISDIMDIKKLPVSDICLIQGSLYHFRNSLEKLFTIMLACSNRIIISEPIKNLSSSKGIIGWFARRSANAGNGDEAFRFNYDTFIETIDLYKSKFNFTYKIVSVQRDIIIEIIAAK